LYTGFKNDILYVEQLYFLKLIFFGPPDIRTRGGSVGIEMGYGLGGRVRLPARARDFYPLHSVQTSSGAIQPFIQWVSAVFSPVVNETEA
jgi:hypothetical protein